MQIRNITLKAAIASLYFVLTLLSSVLGLSSGVIQFRLSEALSFLPMFTPSAIWGLSIGCVLSNIIAGSMAFDVVFGSIATLIGAVIARDISKRTDNPILINIPNIMSNSIIVPFILKYVYSFEGSFLLFFATVAVGEIVCSGVLGSIFCNIFKKYYVKIGQNK